MAELSGDLGSGACSRGGVDRRPTKRQLGQCAPVRSGFSIPGWRSAGDLRGALKRAGGRFEAAREGTKRTMFNVGLHREKGLARDREGERYSAHVHAGDASGCSPCARHSKEAYRWRGYRCLLKEVVVSVGGERVEFRLADWIVESVVEDGGGGA